MDRRHALAVTTAILPMLLAIALPSPAAAARAVTFEVVSVTTAQRGTDTAPKGVINRGDVVRLHDHLLSTDRTFGTTAGQVIGTDRETIHLISKTAGTFTGTSSLPGGTLTIRGRYDASRMIARVTGGTGFWAHATGTVTVTTKGSGAPVPNTYRLHLPNGGGPLPTFGLKTV